MFNAASTICVLTILETVWGTGWGAASPKIKLTLSEKEKVRDCHRKKNKSGLVRTKPITVDNLHRESNDALIRL